MNRFIYAAAFAVGLFAVAWVGLGFVGVSALALVLTAVIAAVYGLGAFELQRFRAATATLSAALADTAAPVADVGAWLQGLHPSLQSPVRLRIEGERVALPGPALTPYLVGLLVMLGMLGTFLGMVVTFKGAVFALEGSTDLQAIRSALAAPIKGLGLSFGTSVAGVAASAMLGLLSALCRRDRLEASRQLDARIATVFRPFSLVHQRQETFKALQLQAHALPAVAERLQAMVDGIERRSQQLDAQLQARQDAFHHDVRLAYTGLADAVGASLKDALAAGSRAAGESLAPVIASAMSTVADTSKTMHQRVFEATEAQLAGVAERFGATADTVSAGWTAALAEQADSGARQAERLDRTLTGFSEVFEQRTGALLAQVGKTLSQAQAEQAAAEQQRLEAWTEALAATAGGLHGEWQRAGTEALAAQRAICQALEASAGEIGERASQQADETLNGLARLMAQSEALVAAHTAAESHFIEQQRERMDQLAGVWRTELAALREEEAGRGHAAVERLGELQAALASQLATLGTALEAPMTRLMHTAAEVPQAAAGVISQLREEMAGFAERDNLALEERTALLGQIGTLLTTLNQASGEQRAAIDDLVASARATFEEAGGRFTETLVTQAGRAEDTAAHVAASAAELASLGESFSHGIALFNSSNEKLIDSLRGMEGAIGQSTARSDEQLAYYVAQAREVIDLSMASQQEIVEDLRRLRSQSTQATHATPVAAAAAAEGSAA